MIVFERSEEKKGEREREKKSMKGAWTERQMKSDRRDEGASWKDGRLAS